MIVRKVVFPVAGLGTRFLPATKAVPKEMLPVVDKPLIQYAAEEAVRAGIHELIFVVSPSRTAIQDHFSPSAELETLLERKARHDLLHQVRSVLPAGVSCHFVSQAEPLGLGHAVLRARELVGDEPFAVALPDDLIEDGSRGVLAQMVALFQEHRRSIIAVEPVPREETHKYGIVSMESGADGLGAIKAIVEKPKPADAPSNLAVVGRYVFTPKLLECLARTAAGSGGEIQLTDAVAMLLSCEEVFAFSFAGRRFDCGSKLGMLQATVAFALQDPEIGEQFADHLEKVRGEPGQRN
ncbi:MAG: UTP--glucose-1-phosphate uridylyltransferase GalU [Gammaproteobacteria bacterium]|nr:UTP--glucose-1-phosphate uridylyltransferase GalU [Gammaproteobacteria bacterium]